MQSICHKPAYASGNLAILLARAEGVEKRVDVHDEGGRNGLSGVEKWDWTS